MSETMDKIIEGQNIWVNQQLIAVWETLERISEKEELNYCRRNGRKIVQKGELMNPVSLTTVPKGDTKFYSMAPQDSYEKEVDGE